MSKLAFGALWVLTLALPMENMFVIGNVGTVSRFIGVLCLLLTVASLIIEKRFRPFGPTHFIFAGFVLWCMATFYWSVDPELSKKSIRTLVQLFIFIWLIWELAREESQRLLLMQAYVFGCFASAGSTFFSFWQGQATYYQRYATTGFDPNDLGLTLTLALPMAWYLAHKSQRFWLRIGYRLYLPVVFLAVLLTSSRASFIALLVAFFYVIWTFGRLSMLRRCVLWTSMVVGGYWVLTLVPASTWDRLGTIGSELGAGGLGGRISIWYDALRVLAENPLLGVGTGAFREGLLSVHGYEAAAHNLFLSILVEQGLIGFCLFASLLIFLFVGLKHLSADARAMWLFVLLTWLTGVMTLSWTYRKPTWLIVGLLATAVAGRRSEEQMQEQPVLDAAEVLP